jgi:hypothetical protein
MTQPADATDAFARDVRIYVFGEAANTGRVSQPPEIAAAMGPSQVEEALRRLAAGKVLILAPNDGNIWAANPFCAVPSPFRVEARGKTYWGICIWDALGIVAAQPPPRPNLLLFVEPRRMAHSYRFLCRALDSIGNASGFARNYVRGNQRTCVARQPRSGSRTKVISLAKGGGP